MSWFFKKKKSKKAVEGEGYEKYTENKEENEVGGDTEWGGRNETTGESGDTSGSHMDVHLDFSYMEQNDEVILDENDMDDPYLNAAFQNLETDGNDFDLMDHFDGEFSKEDMALFDEFERDQVKAAAPDPKVVAAMKEKIASCEKDILNHKRQGLMARKKGNNELALRHAKQYKALEIKLEELKEDLEVLGHGGVTGPTEDVNLDDMSELQDDDNVLGVEGMKSLISGSQAMTMSHNSCRSSKKKVEKTNTTLEKIKAGHATASSNASGPPSVIQGYPDGSASSVVSNLTDATPLSVNEQAFSFLEAAIEEALNLYLSESKKLRKEGHEGKATRRFKQYKELMDQLSIVKARKSLPYEVTPPLFEWKINSQQYFYQDLTLAETAIRLEVMSIHDIDLLLKTHGSSREMSMTYSSDFLADKQPAEVIPTARDGKPIKYKPDNKVAMAAERNRLMGRNIAFRRSSTCENQFKRRKITLTLSLLKGLFKSSAVTLGQVKVPLDGLLTKCSVEGEYPITECGGKRGIGGYIKVVVSVRTPICQPNGETRTTEQRNLVIGEWPDCKPPIQTASASKPRGESISSESKPQVENRNSIKRNNSGGDSKTNAKGITKEKSEMFAVLSRHEKDDPLNVRWLESNDVLTAEIDRIDDEIERLQKAIRASKASGKHDEADDLELDMGSLECRKIEVEAKLIALQSQVEKGLLTLESYMEKVKARLEQDKKLAVYCSMNNNKEWALAITKRVMIMQTEIKNAEGSSCSEPEDDGGNNDELSSGSEEPSESGVNCKQDSPPDESNSSNSGAKSQDKFAVLSRHEKDDPLNVRWLESNDVLTAEIDRIDDEIERLQKAIRASKASGKHDEADDLELDMGSLECRKIEVEAKLIALQSQVEKGLLTLESYMEKVKARLEQDKKLAVYCSMNNNKEWALAITKRVMIMQTEIKNAEAMA